MGSRLEKNAESVRKRIEGHTFDTEEGDEYDGSKFGGFEDYFRRKKIKLQNLDADIRSSSSNNPKIFRGIVAHVNGYTQPSLNDLHKIIVSHGGGFMQYLDGKTTVTHIIASNLTPKKAIEFRQYRVVKPAWIVDSVNAGKLLPWNAYRVVDEGVRQGVLAFENGKVVSHTNFTVKSYREQTKTSWYTSQVQSVVDNIDGDDGAKFPSSQVVSHMTSEFLDLPSNSIEKTTRVEESISAIESDDVPGSSWAYDVSSSLEDALNHAVTGKQSEQDVLQVLDHEHGIVSKESDYHVSVPPNAQSSGSSPTDNNFVETLRDSPEAGSPSPSKGAKLLTAEEHNAILLADPRIRKSSTANPDFLKQYYSESRLHHLSTWKADLKLRFQQMASEKSASQKPRKRKLGSRRYVMHVDFDSFFCAVSLKSAPEFMDKPTVVAHGSGTGSEIASCNYPARAFGVKNGMWMKEALKLCPDLKVLPYDFPAYEEASKGFYEAIIDIGGVVQSVSIDEALVDISSLCETTIISPHAIDNNQKIIWQEQEKADAIAGKLRKTIKEVTGCTVSVGIGANILLAKVALRKAKPAGQYQIKPEHVLDFIGDLAVKDLPGVAHSIGGKLEELGITLVKDIRLITKERLMTILGPKTGEKIWEYSKGIDKTEVGEQVIRKSVSAEVNWGIRFISQDEAEEFVRNLCLELQRRLIEQKVRGRQLTMKIMKKASNAPLDPPKHLGHGKCDTYNKSISLGVATNSGEVTGREAVSILRSYGFSPGELRGLGIQMTKLESLKPSFSDYPDGSQRRINFMKSANPKPKSFLEDPIDDPTIGNPATPRKAMSSSPTMLNNSADDPIDESITPPKAKAQLDKSLSKDPIDDIDSPEKIQLTTVHPAAAITRANAADKSAKKPLNLTGTQFILPTQIDPTVLAELPQDIRSKLMAQRTLRKDNVPLMKKTKNAPGSRENILHHSQHDPQVIESLPADLRAEMTRGKENTRSESRPLSREISPFIHSRSQSPVSPARRGKVLPFLPSQFDPDVFAALPEDMKDEILKSYVSRPPLTPKKPKAAPPAKRWTPTKKRGRPPGSKNKREDPHAALTQSNFVAAKREALMLPDEDEEESEDPDLEYLSALPEELRAEVLAEHQRKQLVKKGILATTILKKRRKVPELAPAGPNLLSLPPRPPKPTFTTQELSTLEELRETVSVWYREFSDDGPNWEDVSAMERYLRRVVVDERDMAKVVGILKWIAWLVDESDDGIGTTAWRNALQDMKEKVQLAIKDRGLAPLDI